jgi:uncharacterized membrane protein
MLGFIASFPINLATFWLQLYILSNGWYTAAAIFLLVAATYWFINRRTSLSTIVFVTLVYSILFNLFASWFMVNVLHSSFSGLSIIVILLLTVILVFLTNFIGSHPISRYMNRTKRKRRREAWNNEIRLATKGKVRKQRYPNKTINRRPKKKFPF